jgi:hypothetical protein
MPSLNSFGSDVVDGAVGVFLLICCQTGLSTVALVLGAATFGRDVNLAALEGLVGGLLASASFAPVTLVMVCMTCRGTGGEQIRLACLWIWVLICNFNAGALGQLVFRGTSETFAAVYQNTAVGMVYCLTIAALVMAITAITAPAGLPPGSRRAPPFNDSSSDRYPQIPAAEIPPPHDVQRIFVVVEMPGGEPPMIAEVSK